MNSVTEMRTGPAQAATHETHVGSILVAASGFVYAPTRSNNLGDRAQLTQSIDRLKAAFPDFRLVAIANSLNDELDVDDLEVSYSTIRYLTSSATIPGTRVRLPTTAARALRVLLLLFNARRIGRGKASVFLNEGGRSAIAEMEESSALFMSGAGTFNDLYMSSVGGLWGVGARCMSALGKPVVASGQQVGPFRRSSRRALVKWALRRVDLLGVRDPRSAAAAAELGVPRERVVLTGDDAWELEPATRMDADAVLGRHGVPDTFLAAQMRFGSSVGWNEADAPRFAASLDHVSAELGLPVVFVPCMTGRGDDDRHAAACVRRHLRAQSWALDEELDARTTKAILRKAALGVGVANHFCVFAASTGTPVVGLHASPYMEQKLTGIGELWPGRLVAAPKEAGLDPPALLAAARRLLAQPPDEGTNLDQPSSAVKPDEPTRFLATLLRAAPARPYGARFVEGHTVEAYEQEFGPGGFMRNLSSLELQALRSTLRPYGQTEFERHLDFACGTGRATGFVDDLVRTSVGVDISANMLERARAHFPTAEFVCGDVSSDPLLLDRLGRFDLVTVWRFVAPAEPELRLAALSAIGQAMTDDGVLIVNNNANRTSLHWVALFVRSSLKGEALRSSEPYQDSLGHRELCRLLETLGLRLDKTQAISYLPDQLTRRLPAWLWMPVERALSRLNLAPQYAVNQLLVARRPRGIAGT